MQDEDRRERLRPVSSYAARTWNGKVVDEALLEIPAEKAVLIVGAGIAGMNAALDLANQGMPVYLVEKEATIGGKMAQLDRIYPTDDCGI